jgi:NAD(P)-dependent dehydrogenase (short-subunit alcohol dehydrogenase family)
MKTNHFHQTAIVTGGATGIGYAVAEQFIERGANVLLMAVPARNWPAPLKN